MLKLLFCVLLLRVLWLRLVYYFMLLLLILVVVDNVVVAFCLKIV